MNKNNTATNFVKRACSLPASPAGQGFLYGDGCKDPAITDFRRLEFVRLMANEIGKYRSDRAKCIIGSIPTFPVADLTPGH